MLEFHSCARADRISPDTVCLRETCILPMSPLNAGTCHSGLLPLRDEEHDARRARAASFSCSLSTCTIRGPRPCRTRPVERASTPASPAAGAPAPGSPAGTMEDEDDWAVDAPGARARGDAALMRPLCGRVPRRALDAAGELLRSPSVNAALTCLALRGVFSSGGIVDHAESLNDEWNESLNHDRLLVAKLPSISRSPAMLSLPGTMGFGRVHGSPLSPPSLAAREVRIEAAAPAVESSAACIFGIFDRVRGDGRLPSPVGAHIFLMIRRM